MAAWRKWYLSDDKAENDEEDEATRYASNQNC